MLNRSDRSVNFVRSRLKFFQPQKLAASHQMAYLSSIRASESSPIPRPGRRALLDEPVRPA
jgi:hypothetical protein